MRLVAVLAGLLFATGAAAHDTVLIQRAPAIAAGAPVVFDLTSTGTFPKPESGPRAERLGSIAARVAGADLQVETGPAGVRSLALRITPARAGAGVLGVTFGPRDIDMDDAEVAHYLEEIGAPESIRAAHRAQPAPRVMRETYSKSAKALFCVVRCSGGDAARPLGHALEFVSVGAGLGSRFKLLQHGRALAGQAVSLTDASGERRMLRTNRRGEVRLKGRVSGPILLSAVVLRQPIRPGERYTSEWASLTLQAVPAR